MAEENRIAEIGLDDALGGRLRPEMERDRAVAIQDLIDENSFRLIEGPIGPYRVELGVDGGRLLGADKLQERLEGRAEIDTGTARRLFTLLCVLHARG